MLTPVQRTVMQGVDKPFAIIASRYNARYVDAMVEAARAEFERAGARKVQITRVPGAFEIPAVVAAVASQRPRYSAIVCLGVILRGQTAHAQQIADAVSFGLVQLQIQYVMPIIHEVLLLENEAQAVVRCLDAQHNRGAEAAQTALEMARVMVSLRLRPRKK